jgi:diguanylate cyclase (GGDEF)-like protein
MFIDLDRFKWINDRMGHNAGDLVLIEAARRMEKCIRESDTIARISGDEFTIILADIKSPMDIECVSDKILSCIEKPFEINANDKLHITASVGVTLYPDDSVVAVELMRKADIAMYRAKESGRNRTVFFTEEMDRSFQERISLEKDLLQAIKYKEWVLYYQPIIDLANNEVVAVEALVRWNHPKLGLLQPNKFIALAEETGLITQLGDWVINEVAMQSKAWTKEGVRPIGISVNVSSRQCKEIDFEEKLENLILDHKSLGGVIRLEITESIMLEQCDLNLKLLQRLKKLGITFSLDDFGTGYSSLIQLKRFPFECLKIEREFIKDVLDDPSDATLVKAIIDLAHNFNMRIVAEGIESREQLEFLREAGADFGQGFYFSKPLMAHDLVKCIVAPEKQDKTGC